MDITRELFKLADDEYRKFHSRLMPTVDGDRIIGVRTPVLRKFAAGIDEEAAKSFIRQLPHKYYEENNLHAFLLEKIGDFDRAMAETERFLPYIDNWATCDCFSPKAFKKNTGLLMPHIDNWLASGKTYTVRYGIGMLMRYFLGNNFCVQYAEKVAACVCGEYYVNMMVAWYFATALAKQYEQAVVFLEENRLPVWVHNKTVSKACDSYRIAPEIKEYLKSLRRK